MNLMDKHNFGKSIANTFIGGVALSLTTDAALAAKLGISATRIIDFKIKGNDIECNIIGGGYAIPNNAFLNDSNITSYTDSAGIVTSLGTNCFKGSAITTAYFPSITSISGLNTVNSGSFEGCSALTDIYAPNITSLGFRAFLNCSNLTFLDVTKITSVASGSLQGLINVQFTSFSSLINLNAPITNCQSNVVFDFPLLTNIGLGVSQFDGNIAATTYNFPELTYFGAGQNAFRNNAALQSLYFPKLTTWTTLNPGQSPNPTLGVFPSSGLKTLDCPLLNDFSFVSIFQNSVNMEMINIPKVQSLGYDVSLHALFFTGMKTGATINVGSGNLTVNSGSENANLVYARNSRGAIINYIT